MDLAHGGESFQQRGALRPPAVVLIPGLLMAFYVWLNLLTTIPYPGKIGLDYNTLGTDWMVFYGAIRSVLDGNAPLIFDGDRFTDFLNTNFAGWLSKPLEFRPWAYPPSFLLILLPFAPLGFFGSYVAFQVVTGALLALALRSSAAAAVPSSALLVAALACPASAINAIDGQAVFLVAALIVGGFGLLERRRYLCGLVLGLLTFKPQFCILVTIALIAARQWRAPGVRPVRAGHDDRERIDFRMGPVAGLVSAHPRKSRQPEREVDRVRPHVGAQRLHLRGPARRAGTAGVLDSTARHTRRRRIRRHRIPIATRDAGKDGDLSGRDRPRGAAFRTL